MLDSTTIIKNPIDWDLIRLREYPVHKMTRNIQRQILGIDTETLDGYAKLIACWTLDGDKGESRLIESFEDCMAFLTQRKFRQSSSFFFNLNFDVNAIIKYLPRQNLVELRASRETEYHGARIFYIPKKMLRITKGKKVYCYYDIAQFFEGSLAKSGKRYLGLEKYQEDYQDIDGAILGTSPEYWNTNLEKITRYCLNDCKITAGLGELLSKTLKESIELYPNRYTSKASITKEYVQKTVEIPDILKVPVGALKTFFNAYSGGRFEVLQKGYSGTCSLFDINSAYPYHIENLIDINKGRWIRTRDLHEDADLGAYLVKIRTKYQRITPMPFTLRSGVIAYPVFEAGVYTTKDELLAYEDSIDYEIIDGWEFYADKLVYPFREYIRRVYEFKSQVPKDSYEYSLYKILMNSLYGCFYEKFIEIDALGNKEILSGKLFNPIYATMITALTRIQLFKYAQQNPNEVIGFATDSVIFKGKPDLAVSNNLGDWSKEDSGETTVLRSGVYRIDSKLKNRGIKRASALETPYGSFKDIFNYIQSRPFETEYPIIMRRPLTFIEILLKHKKYDLKDINNFVDMEYIININRDHKRHWHDNFESGAEVFSKSIDSNPLILN